MAQVNVTIAGRTYRMACDDGQEDHLLSLAEQVNGHVDHLRDSFGDVGDMRLLIMASLVLADDLHEARRKLDEDMPEPEPDLTAEATVRAATQALDAASVQVEALVASLEQDGEGRA